MTGNVNASQQKTVQGYVQLSPVRAKKICNWDLAPALSVGVKGEGAHAYYNAQAGISPSLFNIELEGGVKFPINKNLTLKAGPKAEIARQFGTPNKAEVMCDLNIDGAPTASVYAKHVWYDGLFKAGVGTEVQYKKGNVTIAGGVDAGYRNAGPSIDLIAHINQAITGGNVNVNDELRSQYTRPASKGLYATPRVSAEIGLGKGFTLNGKADLYKGDVGIRYNF